MTVIASCGHDITNSLYIDLIIMDFAKSHESEKIVRCLKFGCYCKNCANHYESLGVVLHNFEEQNNWLYGKTEYPKN